jgi:hypothetical protein
MRLTGPKKVNKHASRPEVGWADQCQQLKASPVEATLRLIRKKTGIANTPYIPYW